VKAENPDGRNAPADVQAENPGNIKG